MSKCIICSLWQQHLVEQALRKNESADKYYTDMYKPRDAVGFIEIREAEYRINKTYFLCVDHIRSDTEILKNIIFKNKFPE